LYLQQSGAAFNAITNTIRTVTWESLQDYVSIYSNRAKANEETADKTTDEVWATIAKKKKRK
jgi:hypothetical protein